MAIEIFNCQQLGGGGGCECNIIFEKKKKKTHTLLGHRKFLVAI